MCPYSSWKAVFFFPLKNEKTLIENKMQNINFKLFQYDL